MTRHLAKLLDAIWYLSMGLFLGLSGGLVLSVILTFRGARVMQVTPGTSPYNDPRFTTHFPEAVAGAIGQDLFWVGGIALLILLGLALLVHVLHGLILMARLDSADGSKRCSRLRSIALVFSILCMLKGASVTIDMNTAWPGLYDLSATDAQLDQRREQFEKMHKLSEKIVMAAWLGALGALVISPWCRRPDNRPLQSDDGKEEGN